jgi:hypothetical protein
MAAPTRTGLPLTRTSACRGSASRQTKRPSAGIRGQQMSPSSMCCSARWARCDARVTVREYLVWARMRRAIQPTIASCLPCCTVGEGRARGPLGCPTHAGRPSPMFHRRCRAGGHVSICGDKGGRGLCTGKRWGPRVGSPIVSSSCAWRQATGSTSLIVFRGYGGPSVRLTSPLRQAGSLPNAGGARDRMLPRASVPKITGAGKQQGEHSLLLLGNERFRSSRSRGRTGPKRTSMGCCGYAHSPACHLVVGLLCSVPM